MCAEVGGIQDAVGDVVQQVGLDLDEVWLAENDNFDGVRRITSWVFEILDLGNHPDQIDDRHRLAHQTRHDSETSNLDLELPIDDFIFKGSDQDPPSLVLVPWPANNLFLLCPTLIFSLNVWPSPFSLSSFPVGAPIIGKYFASLVGLTPN